MIHPECYAPPYYGAFRCSAGSCQHSCCIGWEIDIDPASFKRYSHLSGSIGHRLRSSMQVNSDGDAFFTTVEGDRCPFLRTDGLCDLILLLGEDALCDICTLHPRYRNDFAGRTEVGLGLCCEQAAHLILTYPAPPILAPIPWPKRMEAEGRDVCGEEAAFELELLSLRDRLLIRLFEESTLSWLLSLAREHTVASYAATLLALSRLDPAWDEMLAPLLTEKRSLSDFDPLDLDMPLRQLSAYFITRHIPCAADQEEIRAALRFIACAVAFVGFGCCHSLSRLLEFARMFSAEIEYDTDNLSSLILMHLEEET